MAVITIDIAGPRQLCLLFSTRKTKVKCKAKILLQYIQKFQYSPVIIHR